MDDPDCLRVDLLLSVQRALLGAVPACLRQVTCGVFNTTVRLRFVYEGPLDEDDLESLRIVGTEVVADFDEPWQLDEKFVRLDNPTDLRSDTDRLPLFAYQRKEIPNNS